MKMSTRLNSHNFNPSKFHHSVQANPKQDLKAMHTSATANKPTTKIPILWGKPGKPPRGDLQLPDLVKSKWSLHHSNHRSETYSVLPSGFIPVESTWKGLNGTAQGSLSLPSCAIPGHSPWIHTFPRAQPQCRLPLRQEGEVTQAGGFEGTAGGVFCVPSTGSRQQQPLLCQEQPQTLVGSQRYVGVTSQKGFAHRTRAPLCLWWVPANVLDWQEADTSRDKVSLQRTAARTIPAEPRGIQLEWPLTLSWSSGCANVPSTTLTIRTGYLTPAGAKLRFPSSTVQSQSPLFLPQLLGKLEPSCGVTHPAQHKNQEAKSFKELTASHSR